MLYHIISRVWLRFSTYHLMSIGRKNHLKIAIFAFANSGNQTRAACAASEWAIDYNIASWQEPLWCYFRHHHFVTLAESDITTTSKVINLSISSYFSYQTNNTERQINVKHWDRPIGIERALLTSVPCLLLAHQVQQLRRVHGDLLKQLFELRLSTKTCAFCTAFCTGSSFFITLENNLC